MRGKNPAWLVTIPRDEKVTLALLSGEVLKRTQTSAPVFAVVTTGVSSKFIAPLKSVFDFVVVTENIEHLTTNGISAALERDGLLAECLNFSSFTKLVVINSGVLVLRPAEELFENDGVVLNTKGNWKIASITPDSKKYMTAMQILKTEQPFNLEMLEKVLSVHISSECVIPYSDLKYHARHGKNVSFAEMESNEELRLVNMKLEGVKVDALWKLNLDQEVERIIKSTTQPSALVHLGAPNCETQDQRDWVAIVGMSCRFPQANSVDEYWEILKSGKNTCTLPPEHRTSLSSVDKDVRANFLSCRIDEFDSSFFGYSPSEVRYTDPQARLLLEVSWEAMEEAGMNPDKWRNSPVGVFYGSWLQEYKEVMNMETLPNEEFLRKYLGNGFGCSAAKLSFFYGFTGPNVATESGCSSSIVAVDLACKSLQRGECPVALAAGANILLQINLTKKVVWAEDGRCRTFDARANGYGRAEGVGVLVLKRYSDAIRDNDKVHGVIRGSWTSQEGLSRSFGTPTLENETKVMKKALELAKVHPCDVDYVEAHATGTGVGDPIEAAAIVAAYTSPQTRESPLYIGSGKTNIGHTESCSGIAGIIKVLLAMKHKLIPAHINLEKLNPKVNFDSIPGVIPLESIEWKKSPGKPRIAGVSSFGITGTDVHMILQEAPEMVASEFEETTPPLHILTLSAKTPEALEQATDSFISHLESTAENVTDIAFTSNACRAHHSHRRVVIGTDNNDITNQILNKNYITGGSKLEKPKICFTFPGVIGSMNLDSPRELYRTSPVFRTNIDYCDSIFKKMTGLSFASIMTENCNASNPSQERSKECYACFFAIQYSLFKLWESWNVKPDFVMGHCLGEIVTAVVAGVLRLEDGFSMIMAVQHFSEANKQNPGSMLAIMCNQTTAEELIGSFLSEETSTVHWLDIASINSPTQTVIAGTYETISEFTRFCKDKGLRCKQVPVDFAIHSRAIESALVKCEDIASQLKHDSLKIPYISSVTGSLIQDKDLNEEYWYTCFRNAVQFTSACNAAVEEGCEIYIEIGLGPELSKLVEENVMDRKPDSNFLSSFHKTGDKGWSGLLSSLAQLYVSGCDIDWEGFYRFYPKKKVSLPHYPFERKSFWFERNKKGSYNRGNTDIKELHPLLGGFLPNAMECQIFQNFMSDLKAPYIFDHVVGSEVIFPAAGFLEMILSAGHFSACKNGQQNNTQDVSLQVEDFVIHHPLHLEPCVEKKMQTLLNSGGKGDQDDEITSRFTVHSQSEMDGWRLYASGVFTRLEHSSGDEDLRRLTHIDARDFKRTFQSKNDVTSKFYKEAAQVGLNFGKEFLSLKKVYQSEGYTLAEVNIPEGSTSYICHPILIDAMIQCFILHTKPEFRKLHVPVQIGRFICHPSLLESSRNIANPVLNIYCKTEPSGQTNAVYLMDDNGIVLCSMLQPQLAETTVEAVLAAAGAVKHDDGTDMPNIYEIFWKQASCYQPKGTLNLANSDLTDSPSFKNLLERMDKSNIFTGDEKELDKNVNKLCYLYILKALYDYGWKPEVGGSLRVDEVASEFKIVPAFLPGFRHFLTYLVENGVLDSHYVIKSLPDSEENVTKNISTLRDTLKGYEPVNIIHACGSQLAQVLQGNLTGQYILFGSEKDGQNQAEIFYKTTRLHNGMFKAPAEVFNEISQQMWTNGRTNKSHDTLRILEVGAGTGSFTSEVLPILVERKINFEYFFTDISQSFFSRAASRFSEYTGNMVFKLLDIEKDPLKQGFPSGYFDICVGVDVFHATRNLNNTLKNIKILTRKHGMVIVGETDVPTKELDIVFGILDGYWLFEDNIRSSHCTIRANKWIDLLKENGFRDSVCKIFATNNQMSVITGRLNETYNDVGRRDDDNNTQECWLIIHDDRNEDALKSFLNQMRNYGRSVQLVSLNGIKNEILQESLENYLNKVLESLKLNLEGILYLVEGCDSFIQENCRLLLEPLLIISKQLMQLKLKTMPKFHIATKGVWWNGDEKVIRQDSPSSGSLWGYMRNARIEMPGLKSKSIDLDPDDNMYTNLFQEMWLDDSETEVLYRSNGTRYVRRLRNDTLNTTRLLSVPTSQENKYTVKLPDSKMLSDLKFVPKAFGKVGENQVEIEVQCASLNFKDVMTVMKPSKDFENMNYIGLDYSGVISSIGSEVSRWRVGDRVFGCCWEDSTITSHLFSDSDFVMRIPNNVTFSEAATLPAVFLTAWYCMVNVANLRPGQSILVHAASGGVGLIAIQVAKLLGVTVFGTAGSERKRNFVKNLGVEHVFSSRNLEFGTRIREITKGQGVDMILNCLTGPGFKEASLEVCREGGMFVEISKLDIWQPEEVKTRKPSVNYNIVDVMQVEPAILQDIMKRLTTFLEEGTIQPLPYTRYSGSTIVDALTYLQKAKQIGKVIVDMPRFDTKENRFRDYLFNDKSTYLITGGKGAIGLSVAKWMVSQGAKYLVLAGRSPPKEGTLKEISILEDLGAKVICKEVDISDYSQCKEMLDSIKNENLPQVRGIHHCSGVLSDKMIAHQDWNNFEYVLAPKVSGAYNLHRLTLEYPLEFFVVYSSMATTFGNIGQANYAAANGYMDSLIEMRNALGLKGMTVNWGVWNAGLAENLELDWADSFSISQGINALHRFFQQNRIASVAGNVKFNEIIKMTPYFEKTLLEDIDLASTRGSSSRSRGRPIDNGQQPRKINFVELYSKTEGDEGKQAATLKFVVDVLCETLGVKEHEVNTDVNFQDMGMDSLLSIELTNKLQSELGDVTLGFVDMEIHGSVPKMAELIQSVLQSQTST